MSLFITFEGIEGSGKTTQIQLLADELQRRGKTLLLTREPGGTAIGNQIRKILLSRENKNTVSLCELFLYAADRAQHVEELIRPALTEGKIVLCDRYADATTAYQEGGRQLPKDLVGQINSLACQGLKPDLTIFLDCPVELGLSRAQHRGAEQQDHEDRFEQETILFHRRVRDRYLQIAQEEKERFVVLDGTGSIEEVQQRIVKLLNHLK